MAQRAAVEYGRGFWSGVQTSRSTGTSLWMVLTRAPLLKGVVSLHKAERSKPHVSSHGATNTGGGVAGTTDDVQGP